MLRVFKALALCFPALILLPAAGLAEFTGLVRLVDSSWVEIGLEYPLGTDSAYVEVYDEDKVGSGVLSVWMGT
ncbi:MAG: hypothetical protein V1694_05355, partial [Candidatus Eisenbacteria bacterium]